MHFSQRSCHLMKAFAKSSLGMVFSSRPHSIRERESCCVCVLAALIPCVWRGRWRNVEPLAPAVLTRPVRRRGGSGKDDLHITASGLFFIFTQPRYYMYFPRYCITPVKFGTHLILYHQSNIRSKPDNPMMLSIRIRIKVIQIHNTATSSVANMNCFICSYGSSILIKADLVADQDPDSTLT